MSTRTALTVSARILATTALFSGLGSVTPTPVHAQEGMLEEVIVTARRREESLQETPVAVTAFGTEDMRAAQINSVGDLTNVVPGLTRREGRKEADFAIRGVGQRVRGANADPAVGVYVDNIFIPRSDSQLVDAINLESLQVLRGPQGTLFGKNTAGGAVLLTTKKPSDELEGFATGNFGDLGRTKVRAGISGPLTDGLAAGIVLDYAKEDGYMEDAETGAEYGDNGAFHQQIVDIAGDADNGADVDLASCAPRGEGFKNLCAVWQDPGFDPAQDAVYYARVVENPSCRWSTRLCLSLPEDQRPDGCIGDRLPLTVQERAWTAPIWYGAP